MKSKTFRICLLALFCAFSAAGAQVHIFGSVAFDSLPAFLAAFLLGGPAGAVVGAAGHLLSALLAGFPYTVPLHIVIAAEMAGICFFTGWLATRRGAPIWLAAAAAFVLNAFVSPLILLVWPGTGWAAAAPLFAPLALGAALNCAGAAALGYALKKPLRFLQKGSK